MLGAKSVHADECFKGNFIGAGFGIEQDLTKHLPDNWREFNLEFIPVWLEKHPGKTRVGAGRFSSLCWCVARRFFAHEKPIRLHRNTCDYHQGVTSISRLGQSNFVGLCWERGRGILAPLGAASNNPPMY